MSENLMPLQCITVKACPLQTFGALFPTLTCGLPTLQVDPKVNPYVSSCLPLDRFDCLHCPFHRPGVLYSFTQGFVSSCIQWRCNSHPFQELFHLPDQLAHYPQQRHVYLYEPWCFILIQET